MDVRGALLCLIIIGLAGCLSDAPAEPEATTSTTTTTSTTATSTAPTVPPEPAPNEAMAPTPIAGIDCDAVVFVHPVPFDEANALLPRGFIAADLGYLIDVPINLNQAAIGLITFACADSHLGNGTHQQAALSVFVDAPVIEGTQTTRDEVFLNVYELHRFVSDPGLAAQYAAIGWRHGQGLDATLDVVVAQDLPAADPRQPSPTALTSDGLVNGTEAWAGDASGGTTYHLEDRTVRFWHNTDRGVAYQDFHLDKHGRGGTARCQYGEPAIVEVLGSSCPTDALALMFHGFGYQGEMLRLDGVFP